MEHQTAQSLYQHLDRERLEQVLQEEGYGTSAVVVRLAWQLGLQRREIHQLTWEQIDFSASLLRLPDREVPIPPEMQVYLQGLQMALQTTKGPVVLSERTRKPLAEQNLSVAARKLLDQIGQNQVRLQDLRFDYLAQQLSQHTLEYVSRVSGMDPRSLQIRFPDFDIPHMKMSGEPALIDAQKIRQIIESEGYTAGGVALRLIWQLGLDTATLHTLRWNMVDWEHKTLTVNGETREIPDDLMEFLRELENRNRQWSDNILISDRAHGIVESAHLSRVIRAALIRGDCPKVTALDLRRDWEMRTKWAEPIQTYLEQHKCISRCEAAELLTVPPVQAGRVLQWMADRGMIVLSGHTYYRPGTVVSPEQQKAVITAYLANHSGCRFGELRALLGLGRKQCLTVLKKFANQGLIEKKGGLYCLIRKEEPAHKKNPDV